MLERKRLKDTRLARYGEGDTATEETDGGEEYIPATGSLTRSILTPKLIQDFCKEIADGQPADTVCNYLGINPSTYWVWLRKGDAYLNGGEEPVSDRLYGAFVMKFRQATAEYLRRINSRMHRSDDKGWFRDMEILSRRDRRTWSRDEPAGGTEAQFDPDERFL